MRKSYYLTLLMAFCFAAFTSLAQTVSVSYTYVQTGNQVAFSATATGGSGPYSYYWNYGDGNSGFGATPTHTYILNGTYMACVEAIDTLGDSAIYCDTVAITSAANCQASFLSSSVGLTATFLSTSTYTGNATFNWTFGDGNTGSSSNPSHTYANPGTYYVCLALVTSNCIDSICDSIVVTSSPPPCQAGFTSSVSGATASFTNTSTGATFSTGYFWDFGDGSFSGAVNPSHTYSTSGTYNVCLAMQDSATNCVDSICSTVTVTVPPPPGLAISGTIYNGSNFANNCMVYLITADSNNFLTAIDTQVIQQGFYSFPISSAGTYYVKAALLSTATNFSSYLPTYHSLSLFWGTATGIVVSTASQTNKDIYMIQGTNSGGPGFIGGLVSQGANKGAGPGDPMPDVSILLTDVNDNAITHTITDANGEYEFNNLAYGTYKVHVEIIGLPATATTVTISASNPEFGGANFTVNSDGVVGIEKEQSATVSGIYPNPVSDVFTLTINAPETRSVDIFVTDLLGKNVKQFAEGVQQGTNTLEVEVEDLSEGVYFITIFDGKSTSSTRFVKQ